MRYRADKTKCQNTIGIKKMLNFETKISYGINYNRI